jgi:hypothetical protein
MNRLSIITLDLFLFVSLLFLLAPRLTGLPVHEWLGLAVAAPMLLHVLLGCQWFAVTAGRFRAAAAHTRLNVIMNATLFVLFVLEVLSGMAISRVAMPMIGVRTVNDRTWRFLHNVALNWLIAMAGFHIAMNWRVIARMFTSSSWGSHLSRQRPRPRGTTLSRALASGAAVALAICLIAAITYGVLGPPSVEREYHQNELARFAPSVIHGGLQFVGETLLVVTIAYVGRRWFRVHL